MDRPRHREGDLRGRGGPGRGRGRGRGRGQDRPERRRGSDRGTSRGREISRGRGVTSSSARPSRPRGGSEGSPYPSDDEESQPEAKAEAETESQSEAEPEPEPEVEVPIFERTSLSLASNPLPPLSTLSTTFSKFTNLHKLDLSYMQPGDPSSDDEDDSNTRGIETLRFLAKAHSMGVKERKRALKGKAKQEDDTRGVLGETLTLLNLSGNTSIGRSSSTKAFEGLDSLQSLFVLNLSSCSLSITPPRSALLSLVNLRALILSHNQLTTEALQQLPYLPNLNTLVLSHNHINALPKTFPANFPALTKISVSHNHLGEGKRQDEDEEEEEEEDPEASSSSSSSSSSFSAVLPDFTSNIHLREVRISHNKTLRTLPSHIATWGKGHPAAAATAAGDGSASSGTRSGRGLFLLDAGHCDLSWSNVDAVLLRPNSDARHGLNNLTLSGNVRIDDEFGRDDESDSGDDDEQEHEGKRSQGYKQAVRDALPGLSILDGAKLDRKPKSKSSRENVDAPPNASKRKRGSHVDNDKDAAEGTHTHSDRRLAARAGPAPPTDDDDAGVDSDEEQRGQEAANGKNHKKRKHSDADKPDFTPSAREDNDGKNKRAKRGKKKIHRLITGSLGHVDQDEDDGGDGGGGDQKRSGARADAKTKSKSESRSKSKDKAKSDSAQKPKSKSTSKKSKPTTAWDETPQKAAQEAADDSAATASATASQPSAAAAKGQTSIAGIIQVKKKKMNKAEDAPSDSTQQSAWNQSQGGLDLGGGGGSESVWG